MTILPKYDGTGYYFLRSAEFTTNIEEALIASPEWGEEAQLASNKGLAQLVQPLADELGQVSEALQGIVDARRRVSAGGIQLDNLGEIIGVPRQPATYSTVTLTLGGTPATDIAAGKRSRVLGTSIYWALVDLATIEGGGTVDAAAQCAVIGSQEATAASITGIVDLVTGWDTVTNAAAAITGDDVEIDSVYRRRMARSLSAGGTARPAAIRAVLERLDFITAAAVIENLTLFTDARSIPGISYRPIVTPSGLSTAQKELVVLAIWLVTPCGIRINGAEAFTVTDDQGYEQPIAFQYGADEEIHIKLRVWETDDYPSDGDAQLVAALKVFDNAYSLGSTVVPDDIRDYLRDPTVGGVPGIQHMEIWIKKGATPTATDTLPITMPVDETPYFDANISIEHP